MLSRSSLLRTFSASFALFAFGITGTTTILASFTIGVLGWEQGDLESLAVPAGLFMLLSLVGGNMAITRFGAVCVMSSAMILMCLAVSTLIIAPWVKAAVVIAVFLGALAVILHPATMDEFARAFEPSERAQALAVSHTCMGIASNAAASIFSFLFDPSATGLNATTPFVLAAVSCALGATVFITQSAVRVVPVPAS